jgi:tetratricopeptide (TPR) repeat protein
MFTKRRLSHAQGYLELGMIAEAAAELDHIVGPEAESTPVIAVRLAVLHEKNDWPAVRLLAAQLIGRGANEAGIWVMWAYATRRAVSLEAAEKILLEAEQHHPTDATIQFNLGCYACQRGDLRHARDRVDRAVAIDEKYAALALTDPDLAPLREMKGTTDCQPGV